MRPAVRPGPLVVAFVVSDRSRTIIAEVDRTGSPPQIWRDVSLRRVVGNCRRALQVETPVHLIGPEARIM
jgi:hypothetical protein